MDCIIYTQDKGISSIKLPPLEDKLEDKNLGFLLLINRLKIKVIGPHPAGKLLAHEILGYLHGKNKKFSYYPLIWPEVTDFQKMVWACLINIPYGKTLSYKELAIKIASPKAVRAVGQALKRNPWPILLPCHRVIGKDGSLKGFSSGNRWKKALLDIERCVNEGSYSACKSSLC